MAPTPKSDSISSKDYFANNSSPHLLSFVAGSHSSSFVADLVVRGDPEPVVAFLGSRRVHPSGSWDMGSASSSATPSDCADDAFDGEYGAGNEAEMGGVDGKVKEVGSCGGNHGSGVHTEFFPGELGSAAEETTELRVDSLAFHTAMLARGY